MLLYDGMSSADYTVTFHYNLFEKELRDKKLSNTKKKHHYLPESYLRGFTDSSSGILWVYQKCHSEVRQSSPENEGYQKYYYAFFDTSVYLHN